MILPLPAGYSRRRRRLKRTGANAPVLTGAWGRLATNKRASVYTEALLAATTLQPPGINYSAQFQLQSWQQVRWDAYQAHLRFSKGFQNSLACPHSQSLSNACGQFPQIRSKHLGKRLSCCEDCELFSQLHYCRIAPPHPAFSTDSV